MTKRIERKYLIKKNHLSNIYKILNEENFYKKFPNRKIFSVYFDNKNNDMFKDSEEGVTPRKKIRLRWYNNEKMPNKKLINLETKITNPFVREKYVETLKNQFEFINDKIYGFCKPKVFISYSRNYFFKENLSVNIDDKIKFRKNVNSGKFYFDFTNLIEVKTYEQKYIDYFEKLTSIDNIRFSKYCSAMKRCYNFS